MKVKVNELSPEEEKDIIDESSGQSVVDYLEGLAQFWKVKYATHKSMQNFLIKKQGNVITELKKQNEELHKRTDQPRGPSFLEDEAKAWCEKYHQLRRETTEHDTIVRQFKFQIHHLEEQLEEYRRYFSQKPLNDKQTTRMTTGNKSYNRRNKKKSKITSGKSKRRRGGY